MEDSKQPLENDQDFADREALVKKFKEAEGKIKLVQEQVVGEIQDVDAFCKELGYIGELIRQARLTGEKAVKSRKDEIKREIIDNAQNDLQQVISGYDAEISWAGIRMPLIDVNFQAAIKGKKTVKSLQEAANDELARAKIEATDIALVINTNLSEYIKLAEGFEFLFADLQQMITSPEEAFTAMVKARISDHKEREAQRIAAEEAAAQQQEEAEIASDEVNYPYSEESSREITLRHCEEVLSQRLLIGSDKDKNDNRKRFYFHVWMNEYQVEVGSHGQEAIVEAGQAVEELLYTYNSL